MLLETDAPWLNPTAAGGKKLLNEPKNVCYVAQYIADLLNMPIEQIAKATLDNTRKFFRI
jgi:TatD DNase family protein